MRPGGGYSTRQEDPGLPCFVRALLFLGGSDIAILLRGPKTRLTAFHCHCGGTVLRTEVLSRGSRWPGCDGCKQRCVCMLLRRILAGYSEQPDWKEGDTTVNRRAAWSITQAEPGQVDKIRPGGVKCSTLSPGHSGTVAQDPARLIPDSASADRILALYSPFDPAPGNPPERTSHHLWHRDILQPYHAGGPGLDPALRALGRLGSERIPLCKGRNGTMSTGVLGLLEAPGKASL